MRTIWKYNLMIADEQTVPLPNGSRILSVGVQNGSLFLWAEVDTEQEVMVDRIIYNRGTGHPMNGKERTFIGMVMFYGGKIIYHIYSD